MDLTKVKKKKNSFQSNKHFSILVNLTYFWGMQGFNHPFLFQRIRKASTEGKVYAETTLRLSYPQEGSGY